MAQRDHRGMTTVLAPVFRLERLNLTVPFAELRALILQARASAMHDADAMPVRRRRLDIETEEFVMG